MDSAHIMRKRVKPLMLNNLKAQVGDRAKSWGKKKIKKVSEFLHIMHNLFFIIFLIFLFLDPGIQVGSKLIQPRSRLPLPGTDQK